ncbi:Tol-Pal system protein TolQ [uncultured bacterium]|nr:Tol-Pal system protein TolQ [uncultured bacterium]
MQQGIGFAHFFAQTDGLGRAVLCLLLLLSLASWYLIVTKALNNWLARRRADRFIEQFWQQDSVDAMARMLQNQPVDNAFAELAAQAMASLHDAKTRGLQKLAAAGGLAECLTRSLRNGIEQEAARSESGLTVLASAGSAAPYIGLFGTVWGIYHALVQIGLSGQGTLDKVAGPVGEALIMTAMGLAVAIPAVLAFNTFNRRNRLWLARLDGFAHDLYVLLSVEGETK